MCSLNSRVPGSKNAVAASWRQLEPSVQERDMAEVEEMEAQEGRELQEKRPNRANARVS
jgi:hypothetical protein